MTSEIAAMAHLVAPARDVLYLGRGPDYPMALEGALKLKEISYIHAEGYAAGEMKHGPIALIDDARAGDRPRAVGAAVREDGEQHAGGPGARRPDRPDLRRGGIARSGRGDDRDNRPCPRSHPLIAPLVYAVPVQLLAYHVAVLKGTDVDQPRNLAKSVTVE